MCWYFVSAERHNVKFFFEIFSRFLSYFAIQLEGCKQLRESRVTLSLKSLTPDTNCYFVFCRKEHYKRKQTFPLLAKFNFFIYFLKENLEAFFDLFSEDLSSPGTSLLFIVSKRSEIQTNKKFTINLAFSKEHIFTDPLHGVVELGGGALELIKGGVNEGRLVPVLSL